jgi:hypothetical protein
MVLPTPCCRWLESEWLSSLQSNRTLERATRNETKINVKEIVQDILSVMEFEGALKLQSA